MQSPKAIIAYLLLMGGCVGTWYVACWSIRWLAGGPDGWVEMIAILIIMPIFITGMWAIKKFGYAQVLYAVLRKHGFNVCAKCGYHLTGIPNDVPCPECGWGRGNNIANP